MLKKSGVTVQIVGDNQVIFSNGVTYEVKEGKIYKNYVKICDYVDTGSEFRWKEGQEGNIIEVFIHLKSGNNEFAKTTEYVIGIGY